MTLRARLVLFFTATVVIPLLLATAVVRALSASGAERRADARLHAAARAARTLWRNQVAQGGREATRAAKEIDALSGSSLDRRMAAFRRDADLDFLVVTGSGGAVVSSDRVEPRFLRGSVDRFSAPRLARRKPSATLIRGTVRAVGAGRRLSVTAGWYADQSFVGETARVLGVDLEIVLGSRVVASSLPQGARGNLSDAENGRVAGRPALRLEVGGDPKGSLLLIGSQEAAAGGGWFLWIVVGSGALVAIGLALLLARTLVRPLDQLAEGARAVAAGDFGARVTPEGGGEVAHVAEAFNQMTRDLRHYVGELKQSRDELRRQLDRLGATLRSTLDLPGMLGVVLDTAMVTLGAKAGAMYLLTPSGRDLRLEVAHGYDPPDPAILALGDGIAGRAAQGDPVLVPGSRDARPRPPVEAGEPTAVAVPLVRGERVIGVLALYGHDAPEPFQEGDVATMASFSTQASVAIENVLLHQEAQRLSITDGLTGVWNRRYLQLMLEKEIERAQRFHRPLSVLMLDLDHFKRVNDEYGHQRGDEVLVEVCHRLVGAIRSQIDAVARYGGEEFVVVLPETPPEGARVVAEKMTAAIRDRPFRNEAQPDLTLTVSVGSASFPGDAADAEELVSAADRAMYQAKAEGRDRVVSAD